MKNFFVCIFICFLSVIVLLLCHLKTNEGVLMVYLMVTVRRWSVYRGDRWEPSGAPWPGTAGGTCGHRRSSWRASSWSDRWDRRRHDPSAPLGSLWGTSNINQLLIINRGHFKGKYCYLYTLRLSIRGDGFFPYN